MKPYVLQMTPLPDAAEALVAARYQLLKSPQGPERDAMLAEYGEHISAIVTTARGAIDATLLDRLPKLRIIAFYSAGTEGTDVAEAMRRGIAVTTNSKLIADEVADLGMALLLALSRRICEADRFVRAGNWPAGAMPLGRSLTGKRLGIVGMGNIGRALARRADAFAMRVAYFGPHRKPDTPYAYVDDLSRLADGSDILAVCCPAHRDTHHLIGADVLDALGSEGLLINIARGSVVDESALIDALQSGRLGGAGLDVYENEPLVPAALLRDERVVLLPHIGAATVEIREAMAHEMVRNLAACLGN